MYSILALDLGTTTGWAYRDKNGIVTSGGWYLGNGKHPGLRYLKLWNVLFEFGDVDIVYYENVRRHFGTTAAHVFGGYKAIVQMFASRSNVEAIPKEVGTIKKNTTGNGRASKIQMIRAVNVHFGLSILNKHHDQADALAVLITAIKEVDND